MAQVDPAAAFHKYFKTFRGTPVGNLARIGPNVNVSVKDRENWCKNRTPEEQFELDCAFWYGAMCTFAGDNRKRLMIQRIFQTLYCGGLIYKRHGIWYPWWYSDVPIASALSHGGRVVIQTPVDDDTQPDSYWNWLWSGMDSSANTRSAATHDAQYLTTPENALQRRKYWKELSTTMSGKTATHYGVNIACGGYGNVNPISGNVIVDDGEHAHLYLGHVRANNGRTGYIMIGCEDSAPMDKYTGTHKAWAKVKGGIPVPYYGKFASGQTGHAHTFGASGNYSCTGGKKWSKLGLGIGGNDSMFVDLAGGYDHVRYPQEEFYADMIGTSGFDYGTGFQIPTRDQWKKLSKLGALHKRDATITAIDTLIDKWGGSSSFQGAKEILQQCKTFLSNPKRDKDRDKAVNSLKHCVECILS